MSDDKVLDSDPDEKRKNGIRRMMTEEGGMSLSTRDENTEVIGPCINHSCSGAIIVVTWKVTEGYSRQPMIGGQGTSFAPNLVPKRECYCGTCGVFYKEQIARKNNGV